MIDQESDEFGLGREDHLNWEIFSKVPERPSSSGFQACTKLWLRLGMVWCSGTATDETCFSSPRAGRSL